jgi:hypothetical protein
MKTTASLRFAALTLAAISLAAAGCSKAPSDSQIAADVQNKLSADSGAQNSRRA